MIVYPDEIVRFFGRPLAELVLVTGCWPDRRVSMRRFREQYLLRLIHECSTLPDGARALLSVPAADWLSWQIDRLERTGRVDVDGAGFPPSLKGFSDACFGKLRWYRWKPDVGVYRFHRAGVDAFGVVRNHHRFRYVVHMPFRFRVDHVRIEEVCGGHPLLHRLHDGAIPHVVLCSLPPEERDEAYRYMARLYYWRAWMPHMDGLACVTVTGCGLPDPFHVRPDTYDGDLSFVSWARLRTRIDFGGAVVVDINPQNGHFTRLALDHGAHRVFVFDPIEDAMECFHRNTLRDPRIVLSHDLPMHGDGDIEIHEQRKRNGTFLPLLSKGRSGSEAVRRVRAVDVDEVLSKIQPEIVSIFAPREPWRFCGDIVLPERTHTFVLWTIRRRAHVHFVEMTKKWFLSNGWKMVYATSPKTITTVSCVALRRG